MATQNILTVLLSTILCWTAHVAGAQYIIGKNNLRVHRWATARTAGSIFLVVLIIVINWR